MNYILNTLNNSELYIENKNCIYTNGVGNAVPRVTEILSTMIHSDNLMYWANSLGFKGIRYKEALNCAANIGSEAHLAIEKFLKEKMYTYDNTPFLGFMLWYDIITKEKHIPIEILHVEYTLVCQWFGGTLDALIKIGNKIYLIDFKTSNYVTYKYFLQLAAYRYMLKSEKGINIDGVIVLQLDKEVAGFNEYLLDFSIIDHLNFINHCETTFLSLVYGYYNIYKSENMFKSIFCKR